MITYKNPDWWTTDTETSWERVKSAFKRDWDQTKHDLGGHEPQTNQGVTDTVKQAHGTEPIPPRGEPVYEKAEPAYRFGYGARLHYGKNYQAWSPELEGELRRDWTASWGSENDWDTESRYVRNGWDYTK